MNDDRQWGNNKSQKNGSKYPRQKQPGQKFNDNKGDNYSPSTSYNYQNGKTRNNSKNLPRRRIDRYKRESIGSFDRLIKQNDTVIKLLKEIRDRLPVPPKAAVKKVAENVEKQPNASELTDQANESTEKISQSSKEAKEPKKDTEKTSIEIDEQAESKEEATAEVKEEPAKETEESSSEVNEPVSETVESTEDSK